VIPHQIPSNLPPCRSRFHCCGWVFRLPFRHFGSDKTETFIIVCQWLPMELDRDVLDFLLHFWFSIYVCSPI
uniref:Uncharacterized protein n=1 Tax=Cucumis melo TaxID=3656 RepID=A0A9I9E6A3_CUCME